MGPCRLHWCDALGWVFDVPTTLRDEQVKRIVDTYILPRQIDKWRGLLPGDGKEALGRGIELLKQYKITQRVVANRDGYITPFQSTERTSSRVIIYG